MKMVHLFMRTFLFLNICFLAPLFLVRSSNMFYLASEGSSILRRSHDEAERVTSDTLLDDSEEQTKNENGTFSWGPLSFSTFLFSSSIFLVWTFNMFHSASESSILSGKGHEEAKWVDDDELFVEDSKGKSNNENGI